MKLMKQRILAVCLALAMILSVFAVTVSAEGMAENDAFKLLYQFEDEGPWSDTCWIVGYEGTVPQDLVIPTVEQGYWVVGIGDKAFAGCDTLRSVTGGELINIGTAAFADCVNLETVSLGGDFDDADIGSYAFHNCKKLKSFAWTAGTEWFHISDGAFYGCSALEEMTCYFPYASECAFLGCYSLKTIHIEGYRPNGDLWEMVEENGNSPFFRADWDWIHYPQGEVESNSVELYLYVGTEYTYTLKKPVGANQSVLYRVVDYGNTWVEVDMEGQQPGTVKLSTSPENEGWKNLEFMIVDENGDVVYEEYVYIHTAYSSEQQLQNAWNELCDLIRAAFQRTLFYRVLRMLFPTWIR